MEISQSQSKFMLPLQGANRVFISKSQGVAIGLRYTGLSARKVKVQKVFIPLLYVIKISSFQNKKIEL